MPIVKFDELKGLSKRLVIEAFSTANKEVADKFLADLHNTSGGRAFELKLTVGNVELDLEQVMQIYEERVTASFYHAVAEQVTSALGEGKLAALREKIDDAMRELDDVATELTTQSSRILRQVSEDAYWTTSASQNC